MKQAELNDGQSPAALVEFFCRNRRPRRIQWMTTALLAMSACIEVDPNFQGAIVTFTDSIDVNMSDATLDSHDSSGGTTTGNGSDNDQSSLSTSSTLSTTSTATTSSADETSAETSNVDESTLTGDSTISDTSSSTSSSTSDSTSSTDTTTTTESSSDSVACVPTICFARNEDRAYDNGRKVTGGGNVAYQINGDNVDHWIIGVEILTGEVNATSRIVIRESVNNLPRDALGGDYFTIKFQNSWQGVTFDEPIELPADTDFWIDWYSVDQAQATISQGGTSVPHAWRPNDQYSWASDGTRLMMVRVTCCDP